MRCDYHVGVWRSGTFLGCNVLYRVLLLVFVFAVDRFGNDMDSDLLPSTMHPNLNHLSEYPERLPLYLQPK